jgi:hypothetical protein
MEVEVDVMHLQQFVPSTMDESTTDESTTDESTKDESTSDQSTVEGSSTVLVPLILTLLLTLF